MLQPSSQLFFFSVFFFFSNSWQIARRGESVPDVTLIKKFPDCKKGWCSLGIFLSELPLRWKWSISCSSTSFFFIMRWYNNTSGKGFFSPSVRLVAKTRYCSQCFHLVLPNVVLFYTHIHFIFLFFCLYTMCIAWSVVKVEIDLIFIYLSIYPPIKSFTKQKVVTDVQQRIIVYKQRQNI